MPTEIQKGLLLTLARQMVQDKREQGLPPVLSRKELLDDAATESPSLWKKLHQLDLDHAIDELIDEKKVIPHGKYDIEPTP